MIPSGASLISVACPPGLARFVDTGPLPSRNGRSSSRPGLLLGGGADRSARMSAADRATDHRRMPSRAPSNRPKPASGSSTPPSSRGPSTVWVAVSRMAVLATTTPFTRISSMPNVRSTTIATLTQVFSATRPAAERMYCSPWLSDVVAMIDPSLSMNSP